MSIKIMTQVWELELDYPLQSLMLALADHADDDGGRVYPSVPYLAWKIGYSDRQVQRILSYLVQLRLIEPVAYETGGRGHATEYWLRSPDTPSTCVCDGCQRTIRGEPELVPIEPPPRRKGHPAGPTANLCPACERRHYSPPLKGRQLTHRPPTLSGEAA